MKIAFPFDGGVMSSHFGHCENFLLVDIDKGSHQISQKEQTGPAENEKGCGFLPKWLSAKKIEVVIAKGMGEGMRRKLETAGIKVVFYKGTQTPEEIAVAYAKGLLASDPTVNSCDHGPDHVCHEPGKDHLHKHKHG